MPSVLKEVFDKGKADGWEEKRLGEVCDVIGGGTPSKKISSYWDGEIKWATVGDMNNDIILDTKSKRHEEKVSLYNSSKTC